MAINLNNVQYRQFANFADRARSDTSIVQLGKTRQSNSRNATSLEYRTIVPKKSLDWVGNVFRGPLSGIANNDVREVFLRTVLEMCGVTDVDKLPQGVRRALLLKDYGVGKPLTARRIRAVDMALKAEVAKRAAAAGPLAGPLGFKGRREGRSPESAAPAPALWSPRIRRRNSSGARTRMPGRCSRGLRCAFSSQRDWTASASIPTRP